MPEQHSRRSSFADAPRQPFSAPSPMDAPTAPDQAAAGEFRDDQSAAEILGTLGLDQATQQDAPESAYIAYAKSIDTSLLDNDKNTFAKVELLQELLEHAPDQSSDIIAVMATMRQDKVSHPAEAVGTRGYEDDLINLGVGEYRRQYAQSKLETADLAVADDPIGKVRLIQEGLQRAVADESDDAKKQELSAAADIITAYIDRSDDEDEHRRVNELRQSAATTYYNEARAAYENTSDEVNDARWTVDELASINADDAQALEFVARNIKHLEVADAEQPDVESVRAELAEIEQKLGLLYAKREEVALFDIQKNSYEHKLLRQEYAAKNRELFMIENAELLSDPDASYADVLKKMNEAVFASGRKLEDQKLEQDGRGRFKKTIHSIGRWMRKHPILAGAASATATLLVAAGTGGAASGLVAGTLAYIRAEDRHQEVKAKRERLFDENNLPDYDLDSAKETEMLNGRSAADLTDDQIEWLLLKRLDQNRELFERRISREKRRRLGSIGIGLAVGGSIFALTHGFLGMDVFGHDHAAAQGASPETPHPGTTPPLGPGDAPQPPIEAPVPAPHEFAPGTFHAGNGDGFYQILKNMGVEASQRDEVLAKASKELFNQGYAYHMHDGLPGIPRPGNLPQGAIDILVKAAGK